MAQLRIDQAIEKIVIQNLGTLAPFEHDGFEKDRSSLPKRWIADTLIPDRRLIKVLGYKHGRNRTNVWDYASVNLLHGSRSDDLDFHPTAKPIAMVADAIRDVTMHGELVLNTFLDAGTTLLACERAGRRYCGLELNAAYVDVAIARWEAMTGKRAVLIEEVAA